MNDFRRHISLPLCLVIALTIASPAAEKQKWVGTWATAPYASSPKPTDPVFSDVTIREIVHTSIPGRAIRIRLSNDFGVEPLHVDTVHVALKSDAAAIVAGSDHVVSFNGKPAITIPAGTSIVSDAVGMTLAPFAELAISIHLPSQTITTVTFHNDAKQTSYIAPGNVADAATVTAPTPTTSWYF